MKLDAKDCGLEFETGHPFLNSCSGLGMQTVSLRHVTHKA